MNGGKEKHRTQKVIYDVKVNEKDANVKQGQGKKGGDIQTTEFGLINLPQTEPLQPHRTHNVNQR